MAIHIVSFAIGLWVIAFFSHLPPSWLCSSVLIAWVLLALICGRQWCGRRWAKILFCSVCGLLLGFALADYQANQWLKKRISAQSVGKDIVVTGIIAALPMEQQQYTRFLLSTEQFAGRSQNKRLQLSWQNPHPPLQVGERWRLTVRLKPPHPLVNFNALNRLRWPWIQNIHATGYVVSSRAFQRLSANSQRFWLEQWRQRLQQEINTAVQDPTASAIVSALTIGVETGLSSADWQVLQRTGTVHLVVIAGLHISFMVLVAYFLATNLWRCVPKLMLRFPAQHAGVVAALIFALGYGALAGFGIPTQRAVIMLIILTIGQLCYREITTERRILIAFWLVIIIQPGALFLAGFWLSFGAVAWITYSLRGEWRRQAHWRQWLRIQWALFLGLTPLTIYFFQQFSLVSLIANLPAILWIGWVIVPLCLLAALISTFNIVYGQWLFKMSAYLLMPLWHFLQWLAAWPFAGWRQAMTSPWMLVIELLGAAWCLASKPVPVRWLGLLGFLPLWLVDPPRPLPGAYWLTLLDVGQGLALTVQTAHHILVYDTGAQFPDGFDAGRDIVSPYLFTLGVKKIDLMMISHGDNDHSGGAHDLLAEWPVQRLLTSAPALFPGNHPEYCTAGQQWQWDSVPFRVLSPSAGSVYQDNNSSCVLQIGLPKNQTLLTGDIEAPMERNLAAQYGQTLKSTILVVPHHGSRTSSSMEFLNWVQPQYALFSLGYYNRFHFPSPMVKARYQLLGSQQWQTAVSGAVILRVSPDGVINVESANPHRYFWQ